MTSIIANQQNNTQLFCDDSAEGDWEIQCSAIKIFWLSLLWESGSVCKSAGLSE